MKTILISGGDGSLAQKIKSTQHTIYKLSKKEMDVMNLADIISAIKKYKPDYFIHTAAMTRPMIDHITNPQLSISTNIVGTGLVTCACIESTKVDFLPNVKLIYISTDYVYPGIDGNYKEDDALLPVNEYAWSKLGGECAVRLYNNSLILRMALCEKPFPHEKALCDIKKSYMYMDEAAELIPKLLDETGIINVGGSKSTPYDFAKKDNPNVEKIKLSNVNDVNMAKDSTMNINKLNNLI